jgi:hypothetical protein
MDPSRELEIYKIEQSFFRRTWRYIRESFRFLRF